MQGMAVPLIDRVQCSYRLSILIIISYLVIIQIWIYKYKCYNIQFNQFEARLGISLVLLCID